MDEDQVVKIIISHLSTRFPKTCSLCGRQYDSLSYFLKNTTNIGNPISYDAEDENWEPNEQLGTACYSNCACGTTMTLDSLGMERRIVWRLLRWAREESKKLGLDTSHLLSHICQKILHEI